MQKGKTWQRVASAVLAVMMTMSTFSSTIAYAAEPITTDSSLVTDAVSESTSTETVEALDSASSSSSEEEITEPVGTPVPTEMPDETDSSDELWGQSRFFNDETQKNRKRHALRG